MRSLTWDIEYDNPAATFPLYPLGDIHWGAAGCDEAAVRATVAEIKADPTARWLGMGDMFDGIGRNTGDKRSDEHALAPWLHGEPRIFDKQREYGIDILSPIAGQCLGLILGNHEHSALLRNGVDLYYSVAEALQKAAGHTISLALGNLGFVRLRYRLKSPGEKPRTNGGLHSTPFTIAAHHGWGGGRKAGGKALKLEDMTRLYEADVYLMGHVHYEMPLKGVRIAVNQKGRLVEHQWAAVMTGTYLRGHSLDDEYPSYAEMAGYPPTTVGSPRLTIAPATGRIQVLT